MVCTLTDGGNYIPTIGFTDVDIYKSKLFSSCDKYQTEPLLKISRGISKSYLQVK